MSNTLSSQSHYNSWVNQHKHTIIVANNTGIGLATPSYTNITILAN